MNQPNIVAYQGPLKLFNWVDGSRTHCKVTFAIPGNFNPFKRFVARDKDHAGQRFHTVLVYEDAETPCWEGELLLLAWNSSGANGHTATFMVAPEEGSNPFCNFKAGKNGTPFACAMVEIGDDEKPVVQPPSDKKLPAAQPQKQESEKPFGASATLLYRTGWLVHTATLEALGGVEMFRDWVRNQPCCINENGHDTRIIPRTLEAGDPWAIAPMCFLHRVPETLAKSWKRKFAMAWARDRLCEILEATDGLGTVDPEKIYDWAHANGVHTTLPQEYRGFLKF